MSESERMADRNRLLSVLLNVSNLTAQDADVRTLAEAVLERLHGLLFCDSSLCYVIEGNRLVNAAHKGPIRDYVGRHPLSNLLLPMGQAFMNHRQPLILPDLLAQDEQTVLLRDRLALFLDGPGAVARCWLFLPMLLRGRPMGVLVVAHHDPGKFNNEDRVFGAAFAHQAAIEFENARLDRDAKQRTDEVRTMLQVQRAITRRVELEAVLQLIADEARRLTSAQGALVFLLEEGVWRLAGATGRSAHRALVPEKQEATAPSVLSDLARTGRSYHLQRGKTGSTRHDVLLRQYGLDSMLCVPLSSEDGILGLIGVTEPAAGGFRADDLRILSLLASSAVIGVENARLYESERKLRAQEAERAAAVERGRLARELHDAVTQTLFSASLTAEVLPRIWERNPEQARERLEEVRLLTRGALAEMRTLLLELRPKAMEDTPLEELLKQLVNATSGRARIPVSSEMSGCGGLPFDVKLGLYRIAQEALNNIVKHANASHVDVSVVGACLNESMALEPGTGTPAIRMPSESGTASPAIRLSPEAGGVRTCAAVLMEIRDDGGGFDPLAIPGGHLGVGIMRERAESFGAVLEVESEPGSGTTIRIRWQLPDQG